MTGLYVLGILVAAVTARLMRRFFYPEDETPFVMELPPYRMPTWKTTLLHMWDKCAQYLRKMGGMILIASIVVWFLSYYPRERTDDAAVTNYENSYLGRIGQACEPVFTPLGLNWKAGVALISGISAKEIVVSTLGVLYAEETPAAAGGGPEGTADATRRIASGEASQTADQKTIIGGADAGDGDRVIRRSGGGGRRGTDARAETARQRRLLRSRGTRVPHLHPALHPLHRHGGGHRFGGRMALGRGIGDLRHGRGMARGR